ncbi:hypothetical protein KC19_3G198200 [Ceratodon purpureus]|uniref:Structural maintenance of chromosomes protein 5 n=1 Tax=Ceratodon purpureus TaxID=3225 RepID=A0A8T0INW1_CERPU|nr:hypothetical protein KC19_3G198200 [Ceratodon purpureus]
MSSDRVRPIAVDPRSSKRARTSATRAGNEFLPGNIIEIEVHNFMTYTHLKSKPGPRLNLVIGPNGTGKSSLVCAIGIGLAGEPSLLGRATSIGDYVKRGEESGWIKITLQDRNPDSKICITRKINKQNKSEWLLEDNKVTHAASKKEIQEVVARFNIQVNNLTQFLPQDRVCEFAKMTPIQLLEETEKAVGDPELSRQHDTLIKKNDDLKKFETSVRQRESVLANLKANNADLERDVRRLQERQKLLETAENLKKKLPWLKYDHKKVLFQESKRKEEEAKRQLHEAAAKSMALKKPLDTLKKKKSDFEAAERKSKQVHERLESRRQTLCEEESKMREQVRAKTREIVEVSKRESVRQEKIARATADLATAEEELANLPVYEPPTQELKEIGEKIRDFELGVAERRNQKEEKHQEYNQKRRQCEQVVRRIAEIDSLKNRRLQALKNTGARGVIDAYNWVESHRNEFQKNVYGPVLLEIHIDDKEHAKYVENHVPGYIWRAFVTQDERDRDHLQRNIKSFGVPIINAREQNHRNPPPVTLQMQEMGVVARLDQVINAPDVIKHVLNGQAVLDQSFIGTAQANTRADRVNALGVMDLWTPENHYRWNRSLYGSHVSASVTSVRPSRLFSENIDARVRSDLETQKVAFEKEIEKIDQEGRKIAGDIRTLEEEASTLHKQREEILNKVKLEKKKRSDMTSRVDQRKRKLDSLKLEEDCRSVEERLRAGITKLNQDRKKNVLMLKDLIKEFLKNQTQLMVESLVVAEMDMKVRDIEREFKVHEQDAHSAQRNFASSQQETSRCRDLLRSAKEHAERVAPLTAGLQAMFETMPATVEDLEDAINDALAEANAVLCNNPGVLEEYERRCEQIERLETELERESAERQACLSEIQTVQDKWLPTLRTLVAQINETFGHNFREMAVAGEVSLDEHGNDFDKYGILIKVKFRETGELQVLSAHHQSGGERSVSTILYLVSLQDLTHCPFRVVDEINQGMDPHNERKMFQQLVRAASQLNTPQCFLLTPKLLPNLEYTEACTILNIMNGPYIDDAAEKWKDGFSWAMVTQSVATH